MIDDELEKAKWHFVENYGWAVTPLAKNILAIHHLMFDLGVCVKALRFVKHVVQHCTLSLPETMTAESAQTLRDELRNLDYYASKYEESDFSHLNLLVVVRLCGIFEEAMYRFLGSWLDHRPQLKQTLATDFKSCIQRKQRNWRCSESWAIVGCIENNGPRTSSRLDKFEYVLDKFGLPREQNLEILNNTIRELYDVRHKMAHAGGTITREMVEKYPGLLPFLLRKDPQFESTDPHILDVDTSLLEDLGISIMVTSKRLKEYAQAVSEYIESVERRVRVEIKIPETLEDLVKDQQNSQK